MRDCENCKHRVMKVEVGKGTSSEHFWGCECCECEFEPTTKDDLAVDFISKQAIETIKELMVACVPNSKYYRAGEMAIKALEREPILDKIFCIAHPLSVMSTPELEHKAIMQIAEMLEPLCLPEGEEEE